MLFTTAFYTRAEQPARIAAWYTANGLGVAGGGLVGYAIGHIHTHVRTSTSPSPSIPNSYFLLLIWI
jgi:hypothetical protein